MCLNRVIKRLDNEKGIGWKVFEVGGYEGKKTLFGDCQALASPRSVGKWLHEKDYRSPCSIGNKIEEDEVSYPYGFHIFVTLKGAKAWRGVTPNLAIREVKYRRAHTRGIQNRHHVIVAEEMFIIEEKLE